MKKLLTLGLLTLGCAPFPLDGHCSSCETECPAPLVCKAGRCVAEEEEPKVCSSDESGTGGGTSTSDNSNGAGGEPSTSDSGGTNGSTGGTNGSTGGTNGSTSGTNDPCDNPPPECLPQFLTPKVLPGVCGSDFELTLEAECQCGVDADKTELTFDLPDPIPGVELSPEGVLTGSLPAGKHTLKVTVNAEGNKVTQPYTLRAWQNCFLFYVSAEGELADSQVAAARLDTHELTHLEVSPGTKVARFDLDPSGAYLAQVESSEDAKKLALFRLNQAEITPLDVEHSGDHIAHAFSEQFDSLALVTTDPEGGERQLLWVIDLSAETPSYEEPFEIDYLDGLTWSNFGVLFLGAASIQENPYMAAPQELYVVDGLPASQVVERGEMLFDTRVDEFVEFLPDERGFLMVGGRTAYYDREKADVVDVPNANTMAASSDLRWVIFKSPKDAYDIHPINSIVVGAPHARAEGCEHLSTWSADGAQILCSVDGVPVVFRHDVQGGSLPGTSLKLSDSPPAHFFRATFAPSGTWLAFLLAEHALAVIPETQWGESVQPVLEHADAKAKDWNFFFTPDQKHIIVHLDAELSVARLGTDTLSAFEPLSTTMSPPPSCYQHWSSNPKRWCGSSQVPSNTVVSASGEYLAFRNDGNEVRLTMLEAMTSEPIGEASEACSQDCLQFQPHVTE